MKLVRDKTWADLSKRADDASKEAVREKSRGHSRVEEHQQNLADRIGQGLQKLEGEVAAATSDVSPEQIAAWLGKLEALVDISGGYAGLDGARWRGVAATAGVIVGKISALGGAAVRDKLAWRVSMLVEQSHQPHIVLGGKESYGVVYTERRSTAAPWVLLYTRGNELTLRAHSESLYMLSGKEPAAPTAALIVNGRVVPMGARQSSQLDERTSHMDPPDLVDIYAWSARATVAPGDKVELRQGDRSVHEWTVV